MERRELKGSVEKGGLGKRKRANLQAVPKGLYHAATGGYRYNLPGKKKGVNIMANELKKFKQLKRSFLIRKTYLKALLRPSIKVLISKKETISSKFKFSKMKSKCCLHNLRKLDKLFMKRNFSKIRMPNFN